MNQPSSGDNAWIESEPTVNHEAEFLEIVNDFGDPLEIFREAISNSVDYGATWIRIGMEVTKIGGNDRLVITIADNGQGMTFETLTTAFWGLGYSPSRGDIDKIGEKGHGTKIYLRSDKVSVHTRSQEGTYFSECDRPLEALWDKRLHTPRTRRTEDFPDESGTIITIIGYNDNERSKFVQAVVKDYILWHTKVGSVELFFHPDSRLKDFKVFLKCVDRVDYEEIGFGHVFPPQNSDINRLFDEKGASAADFYVKHHVISEQRLDNHPEVTFDAIVSVEGDAVKREYNPMIKDRLRANSKGYRVADRYGIWLCKDYIPVARVNDWITSFGSGSNAFVLLHGFINCQSLRLTANRGDFANTNPQIMEELKTCVQAIIEKIDNGLHDMGLYTLRGWQEESTTLEREKSEFSRRIKLLKNRRTARLDGHILVEPQSESELFGVFMLVYSLKPDLFEFEPLDYNTSRGIDIVGRNKGAGAIFEGEHSYIELKYLLQPKRFNHAFEYIKWIVCWDFDKSVSDGTVLQSVNEKDVRTLKQVIDEDGSNLYFLDSQKKHLKIRVIRLRELLKQKMGTEFEIQKSPSEK